MSERVGSRACYLCGGDRFRKRPGKVRDSETLEVLECGSCGLVFLSSFDHIREGFYEDSGMHATGWDFETWRSESAPDDERRFAFLAPQLPGKRILDVGSGNGGFLQRATGVAGEAFGVELETRYHDRFAEEGLKVYGDLNQASGTYDLITMFHVLEHLPDPVAMLRSLLGKLSPGGRLIVEVPSADDALLGFYGCRAFSEFTYWSCHLFLFTPSTLRTAAERAGLFVERVEQVQRFPLSNHLHWLATGKPGGHKRWSFLDAGGASEAYSKNLSEAGQCDTLVGTFGAA